MAGRRCFANNPRTNISKIFKPSLIPDDLDFIFIGDVFNT